MCVLRTEIQFIVYNDLACEKAANTLCIVLSVTDFIICYEFMKHYTWGTSRSAITRRTQLHTIFLMFKLLCNVTSTWSIRASSEFKPRSTSLSIDSFPCYMSDDRMVTSLSVWCRSVTRVQWRSPFNNNFFIQNYINTWTTLNPTLLVDDDVHCISKHSQILSLAYYCISNSLQKKFKEAARGAAWTW